MSYEPWPLKVAASPSESHRITFGKDRDNCRIEEQRQTMPIRMCSIQSTATCFCRSRQRTAYSSLAPPIACLIDTIVLNSLCCWIHERNPLLVQTVLRTTLSRDNELLRAHCWEDKYPLIEIVSSDLLSTSYSIRILTKRATLSSSRSKEATSSHI